MTSVVVVVIVVVERGTFLDSLSTKAGPNVTLQWTPSNPVTLGTCQSVLIRGVASFQGSDLHQEACYSRASECSALALNLDPCIQATSKNVPNSWLDSCYSIPCSVQQRGGVEADQA